MVDFEAERGRLGKEQIRLTAELEAVSRKLSNEGFIAKAAPQVIEKSKQDAADLTAALEQIAQQLADLS